MLKITLTGGERLIERLRTAPQRLLSVMATRLNIEMVRLQSKIVTEKLSGQVLHRRTGKLAGSIRVEPTTVEGTQLTASVLGAGGPAFYGAYHEEGVSHAWQITAVNARALHFVSGGRDVYARSVMHPPLAMRAFMKPALEESAAGMKERLQAALDEELEK